MIAKPLEVKPLNNHIIWIKYSDNVCGEIDLSHLAGQGVFKAWDVDCFFQKVYINEETDAIAWNEIIELCPNALYLKLTGKTIEEWLKSKKVYGTDQ